MITSQILKIVDFTKTQKFKYLADETLFFLQIKKSLITLQRLLYGKNEVNFKNTSLVEYFQAIASKNTIRNIKN